MADIRFLSGCEVCKGLDTGQLSRVAALCRKVSANNGDRIFAENQEAKDLCFLVDGRIDLRFELPQKTTSEDMTILTIESGDTFSWSAFVPPHRYTLSAYCVSGGCIYMRAGREELTDLFDVEPRIGYIFMRNLNRVVGRRIRALQEELAKVSGQDLIDGW